MCRREEVSAEAQRALRCFATKAPEREGSKPMPSFPDMVAYVQDKVKLFPIVIKDKTDCKVTLFPLGSIECINLLVFSGGSEDQDSS